MLVVLKNRAEYDALIESLGISMRIVLGQFHYLINVVAETNLADEEVIYKKVTDRLQECFFRLRTMQMTPALKHGPAHAKKIYSLIEEIKAHPVENGNGSIEIVISNEDASVVQMALETYARIGMCQFDMVGMMFDYADHRKNSESKPVANTLAEITAKLQDVYSLTSGLTTGTAIIEDKPKFIGAWNLYQQMKNGTGYQVRQDQVQESQMVEIEFDVKEIHTATYVTAVPEHLANKIVEMTPDEQKEFAEKYLSDYLDDSAMVDNSLVFESMDKSTATNFKFN